MYRKKIVYTLCYSMVYLKVICWISHISLVPHLDSNIPHFELIGRENNIKCVHCFVILIRIIMIGYEQINTIEYENERGIQGRNKLRKGEKVYMVQ